MTKEKYWDYINGRVTDDSSYAKIWDSGSLYIETYQVYGDGDLRLDISYTQDIKNTCNLYEFRESICQRHGIHLNCLGKLLYLGVPTEIYKGICEREE